MLDCILVSLILSTSGPVANPRDEDPPVAPVVVEDVAAGFARAARRLHDASTFCVEYRIGREEEQTSMTLAYDAAGRACLFTGEEGHRMGIWIHEGRMSIRTDSDDGSQHADLDAEELFMPSEELSRAMRALLTPERRRASLGPGAWFDIDLGRDDDAPGGVKPKIRVDWAPDRPHVLGWLGRRKLWSDAEWEGTRLVAEPSAGVRFLLSPDTGFLEIESAEWSVRVEKLSIDEELDARMFVVPPPQEGSHEIAEEWVARYRQAMPWFQHGRLYRLAARAAEDESIEDEGLQARIAHAFDVYYDETLTAHYQDWIEENERAMDEFFQYWEGQLNQGKSDPTVRQAFLDSAGEWRDLLETNLAAPLEKQLEMLSTPQWSEADASVLTWILAIERDAVLDAYERVLSKPSLTRFDERKQAVLDGK